MELYLETDYLQRQLIRPLGWAQSDVSDICSKEVIRALACREGRPHEDRERRHPSSSQEETPKEEPTLPSP